MEASWLGIKSGRLAVDHGDVHGSVRPRDPALVERHVYLIDFGTVKVMTDATERVAYSSPQAASARDRFRRLTLKNDSPATQGEPLVHFASPRSDPGRSLVPARRAPVDAARTAALQWRGAVCPREPLPAAAGSPRPRLRRIGAAKVQRGLGAEVVAAQAGRPGAQGAHRSEPGCADHQHRAAG